MAEENKNTRFQLRRLARGSQVVDSEHLDHLGSPTPVSRTMPIVKAEALAEKLNITRGHYRSERRRRKNTDRAADRRNKQISKSAWQPHNDVLPRKSRKGISRASRKSTPVAREHVRIMRG
jgi:hypothetical protein